jgi:hypothetical protein
MITAIKPRKTDLRVPLAAGLMDPSVDDNHVALVNEGGHTLIIDFDAGTRLLGKNEHRSIGDLLDSEWKRYATPVIDPENKDRLWIKMHDGKGIGSVSTKLTPMGIRIHANHIVEALGITVPSGTGIKIPTFWDDDVWGIMLELSELKGKGKRSPWPGPQDLPIKTAYKKGVVVVIDASGSFLRVFPGDENGEEAIAVVKKHAARSVVTTPSSVSLGLVAFHRDGWIKVAPSHKRDGVLKGIHSLISDGPTLLEEALYVSEDFLTDLAINQGAKEYSIVVVTDGEFDPAFYQDAVSEIRSSTSIRIHVLGIGMTAKDLNQLPEGLTCTAINSPEEFGWALDKALSHN